MSLDSVLQQPRTKVLEALTDLKSLLWHVEYASFFKQRLAEGAALIHTPRRKLTHADQWTEDVVSVFADNKGLTVQRSAEIFGKRLLANLLEHGILVERKEKVGSVFRILPVNQFLILIPFRQFAEPPVYIGADSLTFQRHIQVRKRPKNILDLATGSGFQLFSLPWQGPDCHMTGVDVNANAVEVGQLNASWNNSSWMSFLERDITQNLDLGTEFDLIIGNPPIIPTPAPGTTNTRLQGMVHADGGTDGFEVVRKLLANIPPLLTSDGTCQLILCSLGDGETPTLIPEIQELLHDHQLAGRLLAIKQIPVELDSYYRGQQDLGEYRRWMQFYNEQKQGFWYRLILRLWKVDGSSDLQYTKAYRTDFNKPPNRERVTQELTRRHIAFYLADTLLTKSSRQAFDSAVDQLSREVGRKHPYELDLVSYGYELFERYPSIFPTAGAAIRWWAQVTDEYWWKPKYLERVLW